MSSESLHENPEKLSDEVIDAHRAIASIMEELEAVDWYNQRAKVTKNHDLKAILEHNRDEEKEHAAMGIEWLRRHDKKFDEHLKTFLFSKGPITQIEKTEIHGEGGGGGGGKGHGGDDDDDHGGPRGRADGSLGIGSLRPRREHRGDRK